MHTTGSAPHPGLTVDRHDTAEATVLTLTGHLDACTVRTVSCELTSLYDGQPRKVILDCSGVDYISSQGVALMVEAAMHLRDAGGDLYLAALDERPQLALEHLNLLNFFKRFESVDAACAAVSPNQ